MPSPLNLNKLVATAMMALGFFAAAAPAAAKLGAGKAAVIKTPLHSSKSYDFGKNVTPRYARETKRSDGKSSIVYGNKKSATQPGKIGKPHGHTVCAPSGTIDYARTPRGQVRVDKNPRK